jgi:hypothetical protein
VAATTVTFAPILFANLIFAERFRSVGSSTTAFGINLLGAILGGVLEYSSVVLGYRGLMLVVAAAYTAAYLLRPTHDHPHTYIEPEVTKGRTTPDSV